MSRHESLPGKRGHREQDFNRYEPNWTRTEPAFIEPMQCKAVPALPADEKWTFVPSSTAIAALPSSAEERSRYFRAARKCLTSVSQAKRFPGLASALASLEGDFILDGELVVLDSQGKPSFQMLQKISSQSFPIHFYAFDLLDQKGEMLVNVPLSRRRKLLENLLAAPKDPVRLSPLLEAPSGEVS